MEVDWHWHYCASKSCSRWFCIHSIATSHGHLHNAGPARHGVPQRSSALVDDMYQQQQVQGSSRDRRRTQSPDTKRESEPPSPSSVAPSIRGSGADQGPARTHTPDAGPGQMHGFSGGGSGQQEHGVGPRASFDGVPRTPSTGYGGHAQTPGSPRGNQAGAVQGAGLYDTRLVSPQSLSAPNSSATAG